MRRKLTVAHRYKQRLCVCIHLRRQQTLSKEAKEKISMHKF